MIQPNLPGAHLGRNTAFHGGEAVVDSDRILGDLGEEAPELSAMRRLPPGLHPLFFSALLDPGI